MAKNNKWQLYRAGLLNFWYYDEEEFYFADGKLLLRGSNGSGKSVTMQSLIPLLLDGRKSPERLDPFGSRARKIEDYLLGEKGVLDQDERTGYLYLEYKRKNSSQYLTTGIGLRAKRHSNVDFWGFAITDNRRAGRDFKLYNVQKNVETGVEEKIPLTRRELENRLGSGGELVRTQTDYMKLVNKHLFGFDNTEAFGDLIKLLIQLRSPKLSKDFKPTVIYDILKASLPPIADDELRPLSDAIENMDQITQQLEQLKREQKSLARLSRQYDRYNRYVLAEKAEGMLSSKRKLSKIADQAADLSQKLADCREEKSRQEAVFRALTLEESRLGAEKEHLEQHEVFNLEEKKQNLTKEFNAACESLKTKKDIHRTKQQKEWALEEDIKGEEAEIDQTAKEILTQLQELEAFADQAAFLGHQVAAAEFESNQNEIYSFELWRRDAVAQRKRLEEFLEVIKEEVRLREQFSEANRELSEAEKEYDQAREQGRQWTETFDREKDQALEMFHSWAGGNKLLTLEEEEIRRVARAMLELYEGSRPEDVSETVFKAYQRHDETFGNALLVKKQEIANKEREIEVKEQELVDWKNNVDPEPRRHPDTIEAREHLANKDIPYVPFYAAVEFKENVSEEHRERLEAAIKEAGLLDALIVPENMLNHVEKHDRVIRPNPQVFKHTLAEFLYATPAEGSAVTAGDIDNVLASILLDEDEANSAVIGEDGTYAIGLLKGHAPREERAVYIGREARRRYRQQMMESIKEELVVLNESLQHLKDTKNELEESRMHLEQEFKSFSLPQDVRDAFEALEEARRELKAKEKDKLAKNDRVKTVLEKFQAAKDKLRQMALSIEISGDRTNCEQALNCMKDYVDALHQLELLHKDYINSKNTLEYYQNQRQELVEDVDRLVGELNVLEDEKESLELKLKTLERRMADLGAEEIQHQITQVVTRLRAIPDEKIAVTRRRTQAEGQIESTKADMEELELERQFATEMHRTWQQAFMEDYRLGLVDEAEDTKSSDEKGDLDVSRLAGQMHRNCGQILKEIQNRDTALSHLNRDFFREQAELVEYRLTQQETEQFTAVPDSRNSDTWRIQVGELQRKSSRVIVTMEYGGKKVAPGYVLTRLEKDMELQQLMLDEKDRELYEDIIMNSVGRIIRARINRAQQWVEKIDQLMQERDSSSGLTFSLRWKPLTAEHEEEMDTRELVDLLRLDSRLMKEEDMNRITQHFRFRINRAKEELRFKGHGETLHQLIKEILDYRNWFSFTLFYVKEGQNRRELTDRVFYTFSGGEKAMAMYIPLFSAAYSRYNEARDDAPYIISLDEAFAGVDENNIRDMFALMVELGFDYIINSQALWGDYDTVAKLSIAELVRPKNKGFVTVIRYYWDGYVRHLANDLESSDQSQVKETAAGLAK